MSCCWVPFRRWIRTMHRRMRNPRDDEQIGGADLDTSADDLNALPVPESLRRFDSGRPQPDWAAAIHRSRRDH